MLEVSAALDVVLARTSAGLPASAQLSPALLGQVLAESVVSDIDSPPFTKALMDGYAVRSADVTGPTSLAVVEEIAAGRVGKRALGPGEAARIMTGGPIPDGADAVIPHEQTELVGNTVRITRAVPAGEFVLVRGAEMRAGQPVLQPGTVITPAVLGLLAAVGRAMAPMYPAPRLAVVATGDELVDPPAVPGPGQIRNSNGPMLLAQATRAGAQARSLGIAGDDRERLTALVRDGLTADVLVLSGGVSAGKFDFVPEVLTALGVETHFHKIRMKPGKPLLFGTRGETQVFGLPGNPLSSFVGFELFVRPALRKRTGHAIPGPTFVPVPLAGEFRASNNRPTFSPARVEWTAAGIGVRPLDWFGSADLRGLTAADALIQLPAGDVAYPAGHPVPTLIC
jgi:molybdopterin molybdotransferase